MATTSRVLQCTPDDVFRVLGNGWLYPVWVVGAARVRSVDGSWPAPGSFIEHSIGIWPLLIDDSTSVLEWDPPRHMRLRARGWPIGEANIVIDVKPRGSGCIVRVAEDAAEGPGRLVPPVLRDIGIHLRNVESLRRLGFLAEGRAER